MQVLHAELDEFEDVGFCGGRKTGEPGEKPLGQGENQEQIQLAYGTRSELNPAALVGGKRSHHCDIPASDIYLAFWHLGM